MPIAILSIQLEKEQLEKILEGEPVEIKEIPDELASFQYKHCNKCGNRIGNTEYVVRMPDEESDLWIMLDQRGYDDSYEICYYRDKAVTRLSKKDFWKDQKFWENGFDMEGGYASFAIVAMLDSIKKCLGNDFPAEASTEEIFPKIKDHVIEKYIATGNKNAKELLKGLYNDKLASQGGVQSYVSDLIISYRNLDKLHHVFNLLDQKSS